MRLGISTTAAAFNSQSWNGIDRSKWRNPLLKTIRISNTNQTKSKQMYKTWYFGPNKLIWFAPVAKNTWVVDHEQAQLSAIATRAAMRTAEPVITNTRRNSGRSFRATP